MPIIQTIATAPLMGGAGGGGGGGGNGAPSPGAGSYQTEWPDSAGWSAQGLVYDPGSGIASISNPTWGWRRTMEYGTWSNGGGNDNPGIFNPGSNGTYDNYGGFGQSDSDNNYACEWKGYIQAPATGVFNFVLDSDDVAMFWIGDGGLNPDSVTPLCQSNNSSQLNPNSVSLTGGLWYPIRMRFQEWSGAERCQIYMGQVGSGTPLYAMSQWQQYMAWNIDGLGY